MNNKKILIISLIILILESLIFIEINAGSFLYLLPSLLPYWLLLNIFIILIIVLSFLNKLSKWPLILLATINFGPNMFMLLVVGVSGITHLLIYWLGAIVLNIFLIIIGTKKEKI